MEIYFEIIILIAIWVVIYGIFRIYEIYNPIKDLYGGKKLKKTKIKLNFYYTSYLINDLQNML